MNREDLRKVSYYTEEPNPQVFDLEIVKIPTAKIGYFQTWGKTPWPSPYEGEPYYNKTMAIIEEEDGNLIEVPIDRVTFIS